MRGKKGNTSGWICPQWFLSVKQALEEFCAETNLEKDAIPQVRF